MTTEHRRKVLERTIRFHEDRAVVEAKWRRISWICMISAVLMIASVFAVSTRERWSDKINLCILGAMISGMLQFYAGLVWQRLDAWRIIGKYSHFDVQQAKADLEQMETGRR